MADILLWLLGVPISAIILLHLVGLRDSTSCAMTYRLAGDTLAEDPSLAGLRRPASLHSAFARFAAGAYSTTSHSLRFSPLSLPLCWVAFMLASPSQS